MRVVFMLNRWQGWAGAWGSTTANLLCVLCNIHCIKFASSEALMWHTRPEPRSILRDMASPGRFRPEFLPLSSCCASMVSEQSSRTITRRRCWLSCYVNLAPRLHYSQSSFCSQSSGFRPVSPLVETGSHQTLDLSLGDPYSSNFSTPHQNSMLCLRHKM